MNRKNRSFSHSLSFPHSLLFPHSLSFPRRRESISSNADTKLGVDSRLRGNDKEYSNEKKNCKDHTSRGGNHSPLIQLTNLVKKYTLGTLETTVLKTISLDIAEAEMVAIVGASGSGKSTLMNIIGLLDHADSGTYRLQGKNVAGLSADTLADLRNHHIGFVFQQFNLLPRFTAAQNIALPLTYRHLKPKTIEHRVNKALARVGMQAYAKHRPTQLSGGQQQRIAIARALVGEPQVILADEPTGALDSATGHEIMNLFLTLHQEGRTIILVTHDEHVAEQCQRQITLADGQIIRDTAS